MSQKSDAAEARAEAKEAKAEAKAAEAAAAAVDSKSIADRVSELITELRSQTSTGSLTHDQEKRWKEIDAELRG